jgi:hypothetical protein
VDAVACGVTGEVVYDQASCTSMPRVPDVTPLLVRNLDLLEVVRAGARLVDADPEVREDASRRSVFAFGSGDVDPGFLSHVQLLVEQNLRLLEFDGELVNWILVPALGQEGANCAVEAITAWRFAGQVRPNDPPDERAPHAWLQIEAEELYVDLLLQPLRVLSNLLRQMYDAWAPIAMRGISTTPNLKAPDHVVAALETFVIACLGASIQPVAHAEAHARLGATTMSVRDLRADVPRTAPHGTDFVRLPAGEPIPWAQNPGFLIDESTRPLIAHPECDSEDLFVEPFYGQMYHESVLANNVGIFLPSVGGQPASLPVIPLAAPAANYGWLHVPFRKVPRILVHSFAELEATIAGLRALHRQHAPGVAPILFRGQTREYRLPRTETARRVLYDDPSVVEPALLTSASRRKTSTHAFAAFAAVVQADLLSRLPRLEEGDTTIWPTSIGDALKVALGQHYGLATDALDWTSDPLVALWFALTRLSSGGTGQLEASPVEPDAETVVYVAVREPGHSSRAELADVEMLRPSRQRGWITGTSWGLNSNRVARYLIAAVYIPGSLRDELEPRLPTAKDLFPADPDDRLVGLLHRLCAQVPDSSITAELGRDLYTLKY